MFEGNKLIHIFKQSFFFLPCEKDKTFAKKTDGFDSM